MASLGKSFHRQAGEPGGLGQVGGQESGPAHEREQIRRRAIEERATSRGAQDRVKHNWSRPGRQARDDGCSNAAMRYHADLDRGPAGRARRERILQACPYHGWGARLDPSDAAVVLPCPSRAHQDGSGTQRFRCEEISHQARTATWVQAADRHHLGPLAVLHRLSDWLSFLVQRILHFSDKSLLVCQR